MNKSKTDLMRVGDIVRITEPERFVRCGYELTPRIMVDRLMEDSQDIIIDFLEKILKHPNRVISNHKSFYANSSINRDVGGVSQLLSAIAFIKVRDEGFGGKDRKIFTQRQNILENLVVKVIDTKACMTGEYYQPSSGVDMSGEYYYESGGLKNRVSHRLLRVCPAYSPYLYIEDSVDHEQFEGTWIEDIHCERYTGDGSELYG